MNTETSLSFPQIEHQILEFWQSQQVFAQSLQQTADKPLYTFYDGPPFATGLPHHGHLLASTLKDIIPRYFTMCGYHVPRRFGWDCHGLPVEYEIDKKLGKTTQEVVQEKGIAGYNAECRSIVQRYTTEWQRTITRLGRWVDFDNDYKTMDTPFMESVWWAFKQLWDKGLIYQGTKVVPYSTALGTGLSNFEAGSNYQDVQDPSVIVLFKLSDEDSYLAIWTTTPWTLPSNLGICVHPDIEYVKVRDAEQNIEIIVAADCIGRAGLDQPFLELARFSGEHLAGKRYQPLFPYFADLAAAGAFQIFTDDFVTTDDGTGLVHMAPAFGEDDSRVMQAASVDALVCPIDDAGCFTAEVSDYSGTYVKDADKQISKDLKARGLLYDQRTLVHSYPFCPRSDTPLIYRAIPSWYVKVEAIKDRLLANNNKINWIPDYIKHGRFGKWLDGARDWAISRNRVWGTPLPVWINDESGKAHCIGSIQALEALTQSTVSDLHRDHVDSLTFTLPDQAGTYRRIPEVLDCWFESGSMPYAQVHYPFENRERFEKGFPADFIAEGLDQTRGWFYTLTILATALFDQPAFKNVIVNGIIMAADGKKMSKRLRNYTPPDTLMEEYGADALRLYLINSGLVKAEEQRFADDGVKEMVRRTLLPWLNAFKFLHTYAKVDQWVPEQHQKSSDNILDHWLLSRLHSLLQLVHQHMQAYKLYLVVPELLRFIDDLTNGYIRLNRQRFWTESLDDDKCAAYSTLYHVVQQFSLCMAPFTPFLAEHIYQQLLQLSAGDHALAASVHLGDYPQADSQSIDSELERAVDRMQQIILLGRQKRNEEKIKVKIPLRTLKIIHKDQTLLDDIAKLAPYLQKELNVKEIVYDTAEQNYISLYAKPNSPVLGKRFGKQFNQFRQLIEALSSEQIEQLEATGSVQLADETLSSEDILVFRETKPESDVLTNRYISIQLHTKLDPELIDEGLAREVVNRIQKSRKALNFKVDDRIIVNYNASPKLNEVITKFSDYIRQETLTITLQQQTLPAENILSYDIDDYQLQLFIQKN